MTDASFRSAAYALMIEDNLDQKIQSRRTTFAPVAFGSNIISPAHSRYHFTQKNIWQCTWHFIFIRLKIREDVQATPIEVTTSSPDVADDEQFFFTQGDGESETEEQILLCKDQSPKTATEWVVKQKPSSRKPSIKEFTKIDVNTTLYSINGIKAKARIRVELEADLVLKNLKLKILGQPHADVLLTTDRRCKHYKANEDRIILKDGLLFRKNYGETGSFKSYQIFIAKQLVSEVLRNLNGEFGKHTGITKTIIAYREKYY